MPKVIALIGPESSGKTSLANFLAKQFSEPLAEEFAREYLETTNGIYQQADLIKICNGQAKNIKEAKKQAIRFCFSDTDPFSIYIWSKIKYRKVDPALLEISAIDPNIDYLLCYPDLPYESDPLRESPTINQRMEIYSHFLKSLEGKRNFLGIVKGTGNARENSALKLIKAKYSSYF